MTPPPERPSTKPIELLDAWARFDVDRLPRVLDGDRTVLEKRSDRVCLTTGWAAAWQAEDAFAPHDNRFHLGLLPMPFIGNVREASVYILLLNPGLGPHDYYAESEVPEYRSAVVANLRQEPSRDFLFLDPRFAWHGGFRWWHDKLLATIEALSTRWGVSFGEARRRLAGALASIELVPYHSVSFRETRGRISALRSVQLALQFVHHHVLERVRSARAIAIVTRQVDLWALPAISGVVTYSAGQARGASLTPSSPGGKAIINHLSEATRQRN